MRFSSLLRDRVLADGLRAGVRRRRRRVLRQRILPRLGGARPPNRRVVLPVRVRRDRGHHHIRGRGREVQLRRLPILQRDRLG